MSRRGLGGRAVGRRGGGGRRGLGRRGGRRRGRRRRGLGRGRGGRSRAGAAWDGGALAERPGPARRRRRGLRRRGGRGRRRCGRARPAGVSATAGVRTGAGAAGGAVALQAGDALLQGLDRRLQVGLRRLDQRELELGARVGAVLHGAQGVGDQLEQADELGAADAAGLLGQALVLLRGDRELGRERAEHLGDQQAAGVGLEVAEEAPEVAARVGQAGGGQQRRAGVAGRDRVDRAEQQVGVRGAQDGQDVVDDDRACRSRRRAAPASRARRGRSRWPSGRRARSPRRGSRSTRLSAARRSTEAIWGTLGRPKSNRWQRSTTVGSTLLASVVASTKIVCGGGSSSVFRNAFHAAGVSMCASSRM